MIPWELKITRGENGFRLSWQDETEDGVMSRESYVLEADSKDGEMEAMQALLLEVKEYFGHFGSKHTKRRLFVEIRDQHEEE